MKKQIWSLFCAFCVCLSLLVFTACQSNSGGSTDTSGAEQESTAPQTTAEDTQDSGQDTTGGGETETTDTPDDETVRLDELTPGDGSGDQDDGNWTNPY